MFIPTTHQDESSSSSIDTQQPCRQLNIAEILVATKNFDESLVIGHGGFGKVYKGTITYGSSLLTVAIKRLDSTSNQGAVEFWAEVKMLSSLRHCHLVSLIGYCNDGQEMILVYEYMPRGTLEDRLHKRQLPLTWVRRLRICLEAARGIDYLHTGTGINHGVIHRDVKSSNILLDDSWAAKISDFGLSKIGPTNQPSTYVNTMVKGTFGYLDPDYYSTGRLTRKSDVYAFGVVLFEVLCRKRAVDRSIDEEQWSLARWAQDSIKEGKLKQIVDSNLQGSISPRCLKEFAKLADRCLHSHPKQRPTMAEVVAGLVCIISLQEKSNKTLLSMDNKIFGRKVPTFLFLSNRGNSVEGTSLSSLDKYLYTVGGENQMLRRFSFSTINVATENFSEENKILQGSFNTLYKGKLQNGQDIAISVPYSRTGYEFCMNEVSILVKLEHDNLVQLVGYCIEGTNVYLIYDLALYSTLGRLIYDPCCTVLDWNKRYKIILGVAKGLLYLHKHAPIRIIHCDIKPSNILLDESFNPKLSNFELAMATNETDCIQLDLIRGTIGFIAPEFLCSSHLSTKADVYGYGVLVLETITGRRVTKSSLADDCMYLLHYVSRNWLEGTFSNVIDPRIDVDSSLMTRFIEIGLLCIQTEATDRPTMEEVVGMLLGNSSLTLPVSKMRSRMIEELSKCITSPSPVDHYFTSEDEDCISD